MDSRWEVAPPPFSGPSPGQEPTGSRTGELKVFLKRQRASAWDALTLRSPPRKDSVPGRRHHKTRFSRLLPAHRTLDVASSARPAFSFRALSGWDRPARVLPEVDTVLLPGVDQNSDGQESRRNSQARHL